MAVDAWLELRLGGAAAESEVGASLGILLVVWLLMLLVVVVVVGVGGKAMARMFSRRVRSVVVVWVMRAVWVFVSEREGDGLVIAGRLE